MHLNDDNLRAWIDHEVGPVARLSIQQHLGACPACATRLDELQRTSALTSDRINQLSPGPELHFSAHPALQKFTNRRKEPAMKSIFRRPAFITAGLVIVLAIALAFPPVQALASNFLGLFRVQQIRVISFDPAALERAKTGVQPDQQRLQTFFQENLTTQRTGEYQEFTTQETAAQAAGFTPRLPAGSAPASIAVLPAQSMELKINSELMNSLLDSLGQTVKIPADLDGQTISAAIPAMVSAQFGDCPSPAVPDQQNTPASATSTCLRLLQLSSPTLHAPDGFPIAQLGQAMFQVLGFDPAQAQQLSQSIDWTTTLVIPVPSGTNVTTTEVSVDGVTGTLITTAGQGEYTLLWVKDSRLYALTGWGTSAGAIQLANHLK